MSDTPRTESEEGWYASDGTWLRLHKAGTVRIGFARELERELARALRVVEAARALVAAEDAAPHGVRTTKTSAALMNLDTAIEEWEAGR